MARSKKSEDMTRHNADFSETGTKERKPPHCTVCGAVFDTCDHAILKASLEKPTQLPATVAAQQIQETLRNRHIEYPPPLAARRVALMKAIKPIAKADENKFHKYHYASAVDVVDGVRTLMLDQGLYLDQEETGKKSMNDGVLTIEYAFTWGDIDGNRSHAMLWSGMCRLVDSKGTSDDKAAPKAHTQARKYFLIKNLDISTPDMPDSDAEKNGSDKVPDNVKGTTRDPADELPAEPHLIKSDTAKNWQRLYLVAIRRARTSAELTAWISANLSQMAKLKAKAEFEPLHAAASEATLKRHQELAEQPAGQKPLPPRADGKPNPTAGGQSSTSSAPNAPASTSTAAITPAAAPVASGSNDRGMLGVMEEQTFLDGWGNMLAGADTIQKINDLQVSFLDKFKLRMSGMGYAKAQYVQQIRIKQIKDGNVTEPSDAWDFDSWFRTDFLGALSSCEEGDVERLDYIQQKVVIPARTRMTDAQWKQTAKKFREEAARIKGDGL